MERKLKFRAWWSDVKKMIHFDNPSIACDAFNKWAIMFPSIEGHVYMGKCEPMQFTGLLDKNGKEIYEGDIVVQNCYMWFDEEKPNYRGVVEWIFSQWQVVAHCVNPHRSGISDGINEGINDEGVEEGEKTEWEVIGNIYENPELLEKTEDAPQEKQAV